MSNSLLILGAGGHGQSVLDVAIAMGTWEYIAFLDDDDEKKEIYGHEVLGRLWEYEKYQKVYSHAFVGIGNNEFRMEWLQRLKKTGFILPALIHPRVWIGSHVNIGDGTVIMAGVCVNIGTSIGEGCLLNTGCYLDHHNRLENGVHISPGAHTGGCITIGENSWICTGAAVGNDVSISANCTIAAGAAVVKDISHQGTYAGVPAIKKDERR